MASSKASCRKKHKITTQQLAFASVIRTKLYALRYSQTRQTKWCLGFNIKIRC